MANPDNFFKPGQSGNPKGRPKAGWTMRDEYIKALERKTADGTPIKQGIAESLVDQAIQGNVLAIKEINNRIDGMPKQSVDVEANVQVSNVVGLPTKLPLGSTSKTD